MLNISSVIKGMLWNKWKIVFVATEQGREMSWKRLEKMSNCEAASVAQNKSAHVNFDRHVQLIQRCSFLISIFHLLGNF